MAVPDTNTSPEGAAADQHPAGAAGSQDAELLSSLEGAEPPPEPDWKSVEAHLDRAPKTLRAAMEQRLGKDLLADHTRKTQGLADERRRFEDERRSFYEKALQRLEGGGNAPPDELTQLRERVRNGDFEAVEPLLSREVQARTEPLQRQAAFNSALAQAASLHPYIRERAGDIDRVLTERPDLAQLASSNNFAALPSVLYGIARDIEARELRVQLDETKKTIDAKVKEQLAAQTAKLRGLPPTTTRAGTTPTASPQGKAGMNARQAAIAALKEQGQTLDPWLAEELQVG